MSTIFDIIENKEDSITQKCRKIKELFENDPSSLEKIKLCLTPLQWAVNVGQEEIVKYLLMLGANQSAVTTDGNKLSLLHIAAERGFHRLILLLIFHGCDFNALTAQDETAYHIAVRNNFPKCVRNLLMASEFNINTVQMNKDGFTALDLFLMKSVKDDVLTRHGHLKELANMDKALNTPKNTFNWNLLHIAAFNNEISQMETLLYLGAPVTKQDVRGRTALHLAIQANATGASSYLIANEHVDLHARDSLGRNVLHLAVLANSVQIVKELINKAKSKDSESRLINCQDNEGCTPLHLAVQYEQRESILMLLCSNSHLKIDLTDASGETALFKSVARKNVTYIKIILKSQEAASKYIKNKEGLDISDLVRSSDEASELQHALLTTRVTSGYETEKFTFYTPKSQNYIDGLRDQGLDKLIPSVKYYNNNKSLRETNKASSRKNSESSSSASKFFQPMKGSLSYSDDEKVTPMLQACKKYDEDAIVSLLKAANENDIRKAHLPDLRQFMGANHNKSTNALFISVINKLEELKGAEEIAIEKQHLELRGNFYRYLTKYGIDKPVSEKEIPSVKNIALIGEGQNTELLFTDDEIEAVKALIDICSNKKGTPNRMLKQCVGLMDFVEIHKIVILLTSLNPYFNTPHQKLSCDYLVFSLLELGQFHGYGNKKLLMPAVIGYIGHCYNEHIKFSMESLVEFCKPHEKKPFYFVIDRMKAMLIHDNIMEKIHTFVIQHEYKLESKVVRDLVEYIARDFNNRMAEFFQKAPLQCFRLECWDPKQADPLLTKEAVLINQISEFVKNSILYYVKPEMQAQAMVLFILVARECIHFEGGSDWTSMMAIMGGLKGHEISNLVDAASLIPKSVKQIEEQLCKVANGGGNFKVCRALLEKNPYALPLLSLLFRDKLYIYDSDKHVNIEYLGLVHKRVINVKTKLQHTPLRVQSNLLAELEHPTIRKPIDNAENDTRSRSEFPMGRGMLKRMHSSKSSGNSSTEHSPRKISPRSEIEASTHGPDKGKEVSGHDSASFKPDKTLRRSSLNAKPSRQLVTRTPSSGPAAPLGLFGTDPAPLRKPPVDSSLPKSDNGP